MNDGLSINERMEQELGALLPAWSDAFATWHEYAAAYTGDPRAIERAFAAFLEMWIAFADMNERALDSDSQLAGPLHEAVRNETLRYRQQSSAPDPAVALAMADLCMKAPGTYVGNPVRDVIVKQNLVTLLDHWPELAGALQDHPVSEHIGFVHREARSPELGDHVQILVRDTRLADVELKQRFYALVRGALPFVKNDFCVTFELNDEPMPYVQGCRESEDLLEIELSCEEYSGRTLQPGAAEYLEAHGWLEPGDGGMPNFWQVVNTRINTPDEIAALLVDSLDRAYDIFSSVPGGASIEVRPLDVALAGWPDDLSIDVVRMPGSNTAEQILVPDAPPAPELSRAQLETLAPLSSMTAWIEALLDAAAQGEALAQVLDGAPFRDPTITRPASALVHCIEAYLRVNLFAIQAGLFTRAEFEESLEQTLRLIERLGSKLLPYVLLHGDGERVAAAWAAVSRIYSKLHYLDSMGARASEPPAPPVPKAAVRSNVHPPMPHRPRLGFDPDAVLSFLASQDFDKALSLIATDLANTIESLVWDCVNGLGSSWEEANAELCLNLDNEEYPDLVEELVGDLDVFKQVFDGYEPELREHLPILGDFIALCSEGHDWEDAEAFRNQLHALLPALALLDYDTHAFAVTLMLLAEVQFERSLLGIVGRSVSPGSYGKVDLTERAEAWAAPSRDVLLRYDHLALDPTFSGGLEKLPRLPLHLLDVDTHVHRHGVPVGNWMPEPRTLFAKGVADEEGFGPVRVTDRGCIVRFFWGRWYCAGDATKYTDDSARTVVSANAVDAVPVQPEQAQQEISEEEPVDLSESNVGTPLLHFQQLMWITEGESPLEMPVVPDENEIFDEPFWGDQFEWDEMLPHAWHARRTDDWSYFTPRVRNAVTRDGLLKHGPTPLALFNALNHLLMYGGDGSHPLLALDELLMQDDEHVLYGGFTPAFRKCWWRALQALGVWWEDEGWNRDDMCGMRREDIERDFEDCHGIPSATAAAWRGGDSLHLASHGGAPVRRGIVLSDGPMHAPSIRWHEPTVVTLGTPGYRDWMARLRYLEVQQPTLAKVMLAPDEGFLEGIVLGFWLVTPFDVPKNGWRNHCRFVTDAQVPAVLSLVRDWK